MLYALPKYLSKEAYSPDILPGFLLLFEPPFTGWENFFNWELLLGELVLAELEKFTVKLEFKMLILPYQILLLKMGLK